jgi:hypothetical protein
MYYHTRRCRTKRVLVAETTSQTADLLESGGMQEERSFKRVRGPKGHRMEGTIPVAAMLPVSVSGRNCHGDGEVVRMSIREGPCTTLDNKLVPAS